MTTTTTTMLEAARDLRPLIAELAPRIEAKRRIPDEILEPMHEAGMFRMFLPREIGGPELDPWTAFEATEQLSMGDASVGWCAQIISLSAWTAAYLPIETPLEVFARKEDVLAGSVQGESSTRLVDGGFLLSGRFKYASGCLHATWIAAVVPDPRHEGPGQPPRIAALLPASECTIVDVWQTTGLRGTSSNDWTVEDAFVPWERTFPWLTEDCRTYAGGPIYKDLLLSIPGTTHGAVALGTARAAIDRYLGKIGERRRASGPLTEDPAVQAAVRRANALVSAGRAYMKDAVDGLWTSLQKGDAPTLEQRGILRAAKSLAVWKRR